MTLRGIGDGGPVFALAASAVSAALVVLSYPRYDLDWLIWIAFVPFLRAITGAGWRRGLLCGCLAGAIIEGWGFSWVLHAMLHFTGLNPAIGVPTFALWVAYETLPWALLGALLGMQRANGGLPAAKMLLVVLLWTGIEHYYPRIFPWHIGVALHDYGRLVQLADVLGASGLTLLVLLVNVVVTLAIPRGRGLAAFPYRGIAATGLLVALAWAYGAHRLDQVDAAMSRVPPLNIGVVQPLIPPSERLKNPAPAFARMEEESRSLESRGAVDLILWPEGMDTAGYRFDNRGWVARGVLPGNGPRGFERLHTPLVAGTYSDRPSIKAVYNSAVYVLPGMPFAGFYHKNIRVLFGEYLPLDSYLPEWLRRRLDNVGTITAGTSSPFFVLPDQPQRRPGIRFRALICYEGVLPAYMRKSAEAADFLVNLTEDMWYGDTSHVGQHLQVLQIRAIESRISIARATNAGPSGVIDPAGRMPGATTKFTRDARVFPLRPARLETIYTAGGYLFPAACLAVGLAGLLVLYYLSGTRRPGDRVAAKRNERG